MSDETSAHHRRHHLSPAQWVLLVASLLAIPLCIAVMELSWAMSAAATPDIDYRSKFLALIERPAPAGGTDGTPAVERASRIMSEWQEDPSSSFNLAPSDPTAPEVPVEEMLPDFPSLSFGAFPDERFANELLALAELRDRGLDDALAKAAAADRFDPVVATDPEAAVQSEQALHNIQLAMGTAFSASQLVFSRLALFRIAAAEGRWDDAVNSFTEALAVIQAAAARPLAIDRVIAFAHAEAVLRGVRWALGESAVPPEACARMLREIEARLRRLPSLAAVLEGERLYSLDSIQHTHTGQTGTNGRFIRSEFARIHGFDALTETSMSFWSSGSTSSLPRWKNVLWWKLPDRVTATREINILFDAFIADAAALRSSRTFDADAYYESLHPNSREHWDAWSGTLPRLLELEDTIARDTAATRIMLALELYRAQHSAYPSSLDRLVPELLGELPTDPYAPDGAFRYRSEPTDAPWAAFGYTLYSVGDDAIDDGLRPAEAAITSGMPLEPVAGTDWPFTVRRWD